MSAENQDEMAMSAEHLPPILRSYCASRDEAEKCADHVATNLGLTEKTVCQHSESLCELSYHDSSHTIKLHLRIAPANWDGKMQCWAFICSAERSDFPFALKPKHWRKIPSYFYADARELVENIKALQYEGDNRLVGQLSQWNEDRGFGFLTCPGIPKILLHIKDVRLGDGSRLHQGQWLSFVLDASPKGYKALQAELRHPNQK
jgi:cold shock CspA family protein